MKEPFGHAQQLMCAVFGIVTLKNKALTSLTKVENVFLGTLYGIVNRTLLNIHIKIKTTMETWKRMHGVVNAQRQFGRVAQEVKDEPLHRYVPQFSQTAILY